MRERRGREVCRVREERVYRCVRASVRDCKTRERESKIPVQGRGGRERRCKRAQKSAVCVGVCRERWNRHAMVAERVYRH